MCALRLGRPCKCEYKLNTALIERSHEDVAIMRRLLYVDTFSQFGHNALNQILIHKFLELGFIVDLALREGYFAELKLPPGLVQLPIPGRYYPDRPGKFEARYHETKMLRYIRRQVIRANYDYIFFSSFDEIPLYLSGIGGNLLMVAHANVAGLDNPIKRWFLQQLAKRSTLIVFHEYIKRRCERFGIANVRVEPLGLTDPYVIINDRISSVLGSIDERLVSGDFEHIVFAPSGSKYADGFLETLLSDPAFSQFLAERRVALVIKDGTLRSSCANIVVVGAHLTDVQYQTLFLQSKCILLSYPRSFNYRVSAALFECFSNNKPCLLSDIEAFRVFEEHFNYNPYFRDRDGLIAAIESVCGFTPAVAAAPYRKLHALNPTFAWLATPVADCCSL